MLATTQYRRALHLLLVVAFVVLILDLLNRRFAKQAAHGLSAVILKRVVPSKKKLEDL